MKQSLLTATIVVVRHRFRSHLDDLPAVRGNTTNETLQMTTVPPH